jgi:tripartite-type tricarboxylate transporter receptor subunit TctC
MGPIKPVNIVAPIIGSTKDALVRLIAPELSEVLGQPVIVENKPGAAGNIDAEYVAW